MEKYWELSKDEWWYVDEWIFEDSEEIDDFITISHEVKFLSLIHDRERVPFELDDIIVNLLVSGGYTGVELKGYGNFPLDNLPSSIEKLYITDSTYFNQPLDHLPFGLKELKIESNTFTQSLNHLPIGLEELHLHIKEINDMYNLPAGLKKLTLDIIFNYTSYNIILPSYLEELTTNLDMHKNKDTIPKHVTKFIIK